MSLLWQRPKAPRHPKSFGCDPERFGTIMERNEKARWRIHPGAKAMAFVGFRRHDLSRALPKPIYRIALVFGEKRRPSQYKWKSTSTAISTFTGWPSFSPGSKRQVRTVSRAFSSK